MDKKKIGAGFAGALQKAADATKAAKLAVQDLPAGSLTLSRKPLSRSPMIFKSASPPFLFQVYPETENMSMTYSHNTAIL